MAELVYRPVIGAARTAFRALDLRFTEIGLHHVPRTGGAVLASNHVSYLDFLFCGLAARPSRRLVRFMAKKAVFDHGISGPLMRGMKHIPVDRSAGTSAYDAAVRALAGGEIVGVFPEATISRSFLLKDFKSGAARMAAQAGVPLLPMVVWGGQRLWTKGRERRLTRRHTPIVLSVGEPLHPEAGDSPDEVTVVLRERMAALLDEAQRSYPDQPAGSADGWWLPVSLGGSAPTPEEAAALDAAERDERAARKAR